jgi:hypothetical protein
MPAGARSDEGLAAMGDLFCEELHSRHVSALATPASLESEYFSPLLVDANLARRKVCAAIEQVCALIVDMLPDQILSASPSAFAEAPLRSEADETSPAEVRAALLDEVTSRLEKLRSAGASLRKATSQVMHIYWLANHTAGASWDTVAQLVFREEYDRRMVAVTDGYTPLVSWEEKVAAAMLAIKQDHHLTKDGVPLGQVNPRLVCKGLSHAGRDRELPLTPFL